MVFVVIRFASGQLTLLPFEMRWGYREEKENYYCMGLINLSLFSLQGNWSSEN